MEEFNSTAKWVDRSRRLIRFFLAIFLWFHALFLLNLQSKVISYLETNLLVSAAEAVVLVLLVIFSFLVGAGLWQNIVNLLYIYFFPFVLVFYFFYWPIKIFGLFRVKRSADLAPGSVVLQLQKSNEVVLTAPISKTNAVASKSLGTLEVLTRPFRKFTILWCVLVLVSVHRTVVWIALAVLLCQLCAKIVWVGRILWSSKPFFVRAANAGAKAINDIIDKLSGVNFEATPSADLKTLFSQVKTFRVGIGFLIDSPLFSSIAIGLGLMLFISVHVYFAWVFSCIYVAAAKVAGISLVWTKSFTTSVFILAYATDLPNTLLLRVLGGIQFTLVLALGAGTVLSYFRKQLEPFRSAVAAINSRLYDENVELKYSTLQAKVESGSTDPKS